MKKLLIAAALVVAGTTAATAQGYVIYGSPYAYTYGPGYRLYNYAPGYAATYGVYTYAPNYWYGGYGSYDESGNSYRQPNPRSTIRAVR